MLALLSETAQAGLVLGALAGADLNVESRTSDPGIGRALGVLAGYAFDVGPVVLRPEVHARVTGATIPLVAGATVTHRGVVRFGLHGNLGTNLFGYTDRLSWGAGALAGVATGPLRLELRGGFQHVAPMLNKCGNCRQPSQSWATGTLLVGVEL